MTIKTLSEVIGQYELDHQPERLASLMPEIENHLAVLEKSGLHSTAIQLRALFEEQDYRETISRQNAGQERKRANAALDNVASLEERQRHLIAKLESLSIDKQALQFELDFVRQGIRDEIQGAFEDGQAMALTGICLKLAMLLQLDADTLEMTLVTALDGNIDAALDFMNTLLDAMEKSAA